MTMAMPRMGMLFFAALALAAQTPTLDESLSWKTASGPRISPDGRFVAYQVQETNWEENEFVTQIWIVMTATGERYALTHSKKSSSGPEWSPDSKRLAFLSDDATPGQLQLFTSEAAGGTAKQVTHLKGFLASPGWSPDGKSIAILFTENAPRAAGRKWRS